MQRLADDHAFDSVLFDEKAIASQSQTAHTEGNHYWAVDSAVTQLPNYRGTGFEDDFNLPWNAYMPGSNPNSHSFPFHGGIWQEGKGSMALYRFFILDPIQFHDGFHYWISQKENGIPSEEECRKDFRHSSSVAFYYMTTPGCETPRAVG